MIINVYRCPCTVPDIIVRFFMKLEIFLTDFRKNAQTQNFMKIRPMAVQLFHAGRQTDTDEANIHFS